jgi:hypothetical protein
MSMTEFDNLMHNIADVIEQQHVEDNTFALAA